MFDYNNTYKGKKPNIYDVYCTYTYVYYILLYNNIKQSNVFIIIMIAIRYIVIYIFTMVYFHVLTDLMSQKMCVCVLKIDCLKIFTCTTVTQ